jgi:hypothetical protein
MGMLINWILRKEKRNYFYKKFTPPFPIKAIAVLKGEMLDSNNQTTKISGTVTFIESVSFSKKTF